MSSFDDLIHDLNNLKTKLTILASELEENDITEKTELYQDLKNTLEESQKILIGLP